MSIAPAFILLLPGEVYSPMVRHFRRWMVAVVEDRCLACGLLRKKAWLLLIHAFPNISVRRQTPL